MLLSFQTAGCHLLAVIRLCSLYLPVHLSISGQQHTCPVFEQLHRAAVQGLGDIAVRGPVNGRK